ncbi:HlyD family efflux transporter periplasmic adaptor subunit [Streptacidiphilus sp. EB129]|uniref:HlyD family efflux transporter periplasmic adaptor subunit n=1 Tax=Streptacidiphilus sp. EB129 TaxID=3156262 RepID=UPI003512A4E1
MAKPSGPARGMNAALASGEAGVGEIRPVRSRLGALHLVVALVVAGGGVGAGLVTYHTIAARPLTLSGQVTPVHTYYLDFPNTGTVQTLTVQPGDHVKAGQVLATQVSSVEAANLAAAKAAVSADTALVAEDRNPQTTAVQQSANQLDVARAQAAMNSAQGALTVAQNSAQNAISAQTTVITSDQTTLSNDTARYAQYCSAPTAGTTPGATPPPSPSTTASPRTTPTPSPTPTAQVEYCQSLQSQVDKDSAALAQAKANLSTIQSSNQAQQQQDEGGLTQTQSVLQAAQARVAAQGTALTPAAIALAQSQLASAQAQLATADLAFRQTSILAPADGTVADTAGAVGDIVGPQGVHAYSGPAAQSGTLVNQQPGIQLFVPSAAPGSAATQEPAYSALITVYSGALRVTAQLPESEMSSAHKGQAVQLAFSAVSRTVPGRISQILLDPARVPGGTYYDVTISMDTRQPDILAGMSADVTLP